MPWNFPSLFQKNSLAEAASHTLWRSTSQYLCLVGAPTFEPAWQIPDETAASRTTPTVSGRSTRVRALLRSNRANSSQARHRSHVAHGMLVSETRDHVIDGAVWMLLPKRWHSSCYHVVLHVSRRMIQKPVMAGHQRWNVSRRVPSRNLKSESVISAGSPHSTNPPGRAVSRKW